MRNIIKKLLLISMLIIPTIKVYAGQNDSKLKIISQRNLYAVYKENNDIYLKEAKVYNINNKTGYSLELNIDANSNVYSSTINSALLNLDKEKMEYVKKIIYFGYDYPTHNSLEYYFAAQELIWEYLTGNEVYWVAEMDENGNKYNIEKYKQTIIDLINDHMLLPSFSNQTINLIIGQTITLFDKNKVLSNYNISSQLVTSVNENNLIITSSNKPETNIISLSQTSYLNRNAVYYYQENNPIIISSGLIDIHNQTLTVVTNGGSIEINKIDKDENNDISQNNELTLRNAEYELYNENNELITLIKTNEKGIAKTSNILPMGNYYIKEKTPSTGYQQDNNIYNFSITEDNINQKQIIYCSKIKKELEINKYIKDNNNQLIPEENIEFEIYDVENKYIKSIITNEEGFAKTNLTYGTYLLKQKNNVKGNNKIKDINITVNNDSQDVIKYVLTNDILKTKIKVNNIDSSSKQNINNISSYKIKDLNTNKYILNNNNEICIFTTNDKGTFLTQIELPYGMYSLEQIKSPKDYKDNINPLIFNIETNSNILKDNDNNNYIELNFENEINKYSITVNSKIETLSINNNEINYILNSYSNKEIKLYAVNDIITPDNKLHYKKGELINSQITNLNGQVVFFNLYSGIYEIKLLDDNDNLINDQEKYIVTINSNNETINIINNQKKHNLKIQLLNSETNTPISNSIIHLYDQNNILLKEEKTNKEGLIVINNIPQNKYIIKQINTQEQYNKNKENMNINLLNDKKITIYNSNKKSNLNLILKDENNNPITNNNIQIYNELDELVYEGKTNENGMININNLKYGKYYVKENNKNTPFVIKENSNLINIELIKEIMTIEVPNTNNNYYYITEIICLIMLFIGLLGYNHEKRNNN